MPDVESRTLAAKITDLTVDFLFLVTKYSGTHVIQILAVKDLRAIIQEFKTKHDFLPLTSAVRSTHAPLFFFRSHVGFMSLGEVDARLRKLNPVFLLLTHGELSNSYLGSNTFRPASESSTSEDKGRPMWDGLHKFNVVRSHCFFRATAACRQTQIRSVLLSCFFTKKFVSISNAIGQNVTRLRFTK